MRPHIARISFCSCSLALAAPCLAQCPVNFSMFQQYSAMGGLQHLAIGNFNGDAWPDIATASSAGGTVSVLLGSPGGAFGSSAFFSAGIGGLRSIALADYNNDTRLDIAVVGSGGGAGVSVLRGNGDGTFQSPVFAGAGAQPQFIVAADFNADGKVDLAVANMSGNDVSFLRGNGDGTFQPAVNYPVVAGPRWLAVGRFNADAFPDLIVAGQNGNGLSVLRGNGDGTFQAALDTPLGFSLQSVAAGDFNGDGLDDALVGAATGGTMHVLLASGGGAFGAPVVYPVGGGATAVAVADFNLDGRLDAVAVSSSGGPAFVFLGNGAGALALETNPSAGGGAAAVAAGNLDASGGPDLAIANSSGGQVSVVLNQAPAISITQQPTSCQVVQTGQPISLTVGSSAPASTNYQWRKNGVALANGGPVSGATSATLTISPSACGDSASYDCMLSSVCAGSPPLTSSAAVVAVTGPDVCAGLQPSIIQQPAGQSVVTGAIAVFSVSLAPSNLGPTYQWRRGGINLSNGGSVSGATSAVLVIAPAALSDNGSAYDCVVTNSCGSVRSNPAGLAVARHCSADVNDDGSITSADVGTFINEWFAQLSAGCH